MNIYHNKQKPKLNFSSPKEEKKKKKMQLQAAKL